LGNIVANFKKALNNPRHCYQRKGTKQQLIKHKKTDNY